MSLTPPPDALFATLEALLESTKTYAGDHGFAITTLRSKKNKAGLLYKVWLKCDRGGKYRTRGLTEEARTRLTASRCIECPFSAIAKRSESEDWVLVSIYYYYIYSS
jgi:hypothetical protein